LQQEFDPLYTKLGRVETKVQRHHYLTEKLHAETITIQEIRELGTLENEIADELGQKSSTKFDISKVSTEALLELLNADSKGEDTD
jgi:hypothetical protein